MAADIQWPDVVGAVGGIVGVVAAVGVGIPAVVAARRSARAGEESAQAAKDAARGAADVARIERAREHARLAPPAPPEIKAEIEDHPRLGADGAGLFGSITVPRDYRVKAEAVSGNARSPISLPLLLRAGTHSFEIEKWPRGREEPQTEFVLVRFWPPAEVDEVEHWTCPCDRPIADGDGPGHWEWRVPLDYYNPIVSIF
ncbi:hypothetical protein [Micromonospora sp. L32]|uniref:hypothetical protein n=1 Tax=Micromonospora TaxID=1873 RepID=UPI003F8B9143